MFVPVGNPGSGKSALAAEAVAAGIVPVEGVIDLSGLRRVLTGNPHDLTADVALHRMVGTIVEQRLSRGLTVWVDGTNGAGQLHRWRTVAALYDAELVVIAFGSGEPVAGGDGRQVVSADRFRQGMRHRQRVAEPAPVSH